jgi:signal transduction histidine kinase
MPIHTWNEAVNLFARRFRASGLHVAILVCFACIFLVDLLTPLDNLVLCFAYLVPIGASLFDARSHPFLLAGMATAFSVAGSFIPLVEEIELEVMASRLAAVVHHWLAALLVLMQKRLLAAASKKAEFQRHFVDILSHEVGTALTTVMGQAYRLTKLSERIAPDDVKARAEKIRRAADGVQAIIGRIQFASSLGNGPIPVGTRPIDIQNMLRELTEQREEDQHGRFQLSLPPVPQFIDGDEMLLRHMFENVMANSIKYSPPNTAISIISADHRSHLCITITDQGNGISPEDLPRVRAPYYRGENSKGIRGTGLGLYLVEQIIEAHRGRLLIESRIGEGTKVTIELPQRSDLAAA